MAAASRCLALIHRAGIVHNDLKPAQFLVSNEVSIEEGLRLVDFDFSLLWQEKVYPHKAALTPFYFSPEMLKSFEKVTPASDIFCLGLILFESISGGSSAFGKDGDTFHKNISSGQAPTPLEKTARFEVPEEIITVLNSMIAADPGKRPSSKDVFLKFNEMAGLSLKLPPEISKDSGKKTAASASFCRYCGVKHPEDGSIKFCSNCGKAVLERYCRKCGALQTGKGAFCNNCGVKSA